MNAKDASYEGARVVVTGGGSGMGAATVKALTESGAEVHVLDVREPQGDVAGYYAVDLRDPIATAGAVDAIPSPIGALFNCAGVAGSTMPDLDVMLINFVGLRHVSELVARRMAPGAAIASVASIGGIDWEATLDTFLPLVRSDGFDAGRAWCEAHPADIAGGYFASKRALIIWTMDSCRELATRGIRINCISPGPTATAMFPKPEKQVEKMAVPLGRPSRADEQAGPLLFLNSPAASYVTGANLVTDGGWVASQFGRTRA